MFPGNVVIRKTCWEETLLDLPVTGPDAVHRQSSQRFATRKHVEGKLFPKSTVSYAIFCRLFSSSLTLPTLHGGQWVSSE